MKKISERVNFKDLFFIIAGTFFMACGINFAFDPMGLDVGGVTGLAIVVKYFSMRFFENGIPVWLTTILCNVPLFVVSFIKKGWKYLAKTTFATISLTLWIYILPVVQVVDDKILGTLFGGVLSGVGMGIVFSVMATTGGTDLFAALIHEKWRHVSIPQLLSITDGVIVALGFFMFGLENVICSIIVVYLVAKISDGILDGLKFAKMAYIISDNAEDIASEILTDVDRGVTGIRVKGMYSGQDKKMLFCVVSNKQIVELTDIVSRHDKSAFMVIADVREVMGEGFAEVKKQE